MLQKGKNLFFLVISICYAFSCSAQFIDIPEFEGEEDKPQQASNSLVLTPSAQAGTKTPAPQASEQSVPNQPNIGRKAIPLDELVLTPAPLPELSINLTDKVPVPAQSLPPTQPVNVRQEAISLPPADRTDLIPPAPSQFANVHDVRQFDIEGFSLGLPPSTIGQLARQKGYQITKTKKAIPLFQTTYYDSLCRQEGLRAPDAIRHCIREKAKNKKQDYIEEMVLSKKATHESFHILFTSPATGNEAYQIIYQNKGDASLNFTRQNLAKKLSRKEAFVNAVFNLYGNPDDPKNWIWGAKEDAYMQVGMSGSAYDAVIILTDTALSNEDYFEAADWKADNETVEHFGFAE